MDQQWIVSDRSVLEGKPCIRGTRISVELVLELLAGGASHDEIQKAYPHLSSEGIAAAINYAAQALKNEIVWDVKFSA